MTGYGDLPYGGGSYGGDPVGFGVQPASVAPNGEAVDLQFTDSYLRDTVLLSPASYSIDGGLEVKAVGVIDATSVRLYTTPQVSGKSYQIKVTGQVKSLFGSPLVNDTSSFLGVVSGVQKYTVSNLRAETQCEGRSVRLTWTNPGGVAPTRTRIVRRTRSWPYDPVNDPCDVLYDSAAAIETWTDVGATIGNSDLKLAENTYYYYVVCVSRQVGGGGPPASYDTTDDSRVMGLSVKAYTSDLFWRYTPADEKRLDKKSRPEGGSEGYLEKWYTVFACWFTLVKGVIDAKKNDTDDDRAPYPTIEARVLSLGLSPDGSTYDFDTARKEALGLIGQYQIKGSCDGIVDITEILTGWTSTCADLGNGEGCQAGATNLKTWDGVSDIQINDAPSGVLAWGYGMIDGNMSGPWVEDEWKGSKVITTLGDVLCVRSNDDGLLYFEEAASNIATTADVTNNATWIEVADPSSFIKGMGVEVHNAALGLYFIRELSSVDYAMGRLYFTAKYVGATIPAGSSVSLGRSGVRTVVVGTRQGNYVFTPAPGRSLLRDPDAVWETNQWAGMYYLEESNNYPFLIESNTATDLVVVASMTTQVGPVRYAIGQNFTLPPFPAQPTFDQICASMAGLKYKILRGNHSWIYNSQLDFSARGTRYDYYCRLMDASKVNLLGAWGPGDIGVYITTPNVRKRKGKAVSVLANSFTLDPNQTPPTTNALVGMYLNPNENQEQLFRIVENTATTVTVLGDVTSLVVKGQNYYVLNERDANRYRRLVTRLKQNFVETDMRPHVMFVG